MASKTMTLDKLTDRLVQVFNDEKMSAEYRNEGHHSICFGWDGSGLSPVSRPAYVDAWGEAMVHEAEELAQAIVEDKHRRYNESAYHCYELEADEHVMKGQPVPAVGQMVWVLDSGLKCEGGLPHAISNMECCVYEHADDKDWNPHTRLVKVKKVFQLAEEDFDPISEGKSAEVLEGIVKQLGEGDYGCGSDDVTDEEFEKGFNNLPDWKQKTFYNIGVVLACGDRWFFMDTEGYGYSRYVMVPLTWEMMFEKVLTAIRERNNERKREEMERQEREYNERLAQYREKCRKWEHLMTAIAPFVKAREEANSVLWAADKKVVERKIYGKERKKAIEKEQKAFDQAQRKEHNVRRKNILSMVQAAYPGVKFSLTQNKGWGGDWCLTWWDGPTEEEFGKAVDLDLFVCYHDCFDGMTDCSYTTKEEHTEFAVKYMGGMAGDIRTDRDMSKEKSDELKQAVRSIIPDITEDEPYDFTDEQAAALVEKFGVDMHKLFHQYYQREYLSTIVHRIFCNTSYAVASLPPTPPKGKGGNDNNNLNPETLKPETIETAPQGEGAITAHPYTTKKGKAAMYLAGFKDMKDPRYAELAVHNVKPCYIRNEDGTRTYVAYFGARYGEGAKLFAEALTTGNAETLAKAHEAMKQAHPYYGKEAA